jgi:hypothetical protein
MSCEIRGCGVVSKEYVLREIAEWKRAIGISRTARRLARLQLSGPASSLGGRATLRWRGCGASVERV